MSVLNPLTTKVQKHSVQNTNGAANVEYEESESGSESAPYTYDSATFDSDQDEQKDNLLFIIPAEIKKSYENFTLLIGGEDDLNKVGF